MASEQAVPPLTSEAERWTDLHRRLLADDSIQFDLPVWAPDKPPEWLKPLAELLGAIAPYMVYVFWGAVIIGAGFILALIFLEVSGVAWRLPWQRDRQEEKEEEIWRPDVTVAQILLSEADELAARGHYDEAVHLLLKRSVADIAARMPNFLRPSLTARDIANAPLLPKQPRHAFGKIASIVETALFAKKPVGSTQWQEARQAYENFAFKEAWA